MKTIDQYIEDSGLLVMKDILSHGFSKSQVYAFIGKNKYEKISHGIYASSETWIDENYVLSLRCSNAIFSHDEALYYHGLIDREPTQQTITIYTGYSTSRLVDSGIKVYTIKKELLNVGKIEVINDSGHRIPMYDLERTICDLVRSKSQFEIQDFSTALKTYVLRKDKDLNKLMYYAKLFHIEKKIRNYMEVLL